LRRKIFEETLGGKLVRGISGKAVKGGKLVDK